MTQSSNLKIIHCSNPACRRALAQTDGAKIFPVNDRVFANKLSDEKKKFKPLYCVHCHRITRCYKPKFESHIKKPNKKDGS